MTIKHNTTCAILFFVLITVLNVAFADHDNNLEQIPALEKRAPSLGQKVNVPSRKNTAMHLPNHLAFDSSLMNSMLANSTSFNNELNILDAKNHLASSTLYLGGYGQGGGNFAKAARSTFFYSNQLTYKSRNYISIDRAAFSLIANVNSWAGVYLETGAIDIGQPYFSPLRLNQTYLLLGDGVFPFYGFAGSLYMTKKPVMPAQAGNHLWLGTVIK